jgi:hypothetical protein
VYRLPPPPALGASGPNALHQGQAIIGRSVHKNVAQGGGLRKSKGRSARSGPAFFEALRPVVTAPAPCTAG